MNCNTCMFVHILLSKQIFTFLNMCTLRHTPTVSTQWRWVRLWAVRYTRRFDTVWQSRITCWEQTTDYSQRTETEWLLIRHISTIFGYVPTYRNILRQSLDKNTCADTLVSECKRKKEKTALDLGLRTPQADLRERKKVRQMIYVMRKILCIAHIYYPVFNLRDKWFMFEK